MKQRIEGGYYIKARCIQDKKIAHCPPHVREIWDWLLMKANHKDSTYRGHTVLRGQYFTSYSDIREALHWAAGWRKIMYSENHTKKAMKELRELSCITTRKEPLEN